MRKPGRVKLKGADPSASVLSANLGQAEKLNRRPEGITDRSPNKTADRPNTTRNVRCHPNLPRISH